MNTELLYSIFPKLEKRLITKMEAGNIRILFTALEGDAESAMLKDVEMFMDKVIHVK